jgi:CheY-like chemotaxis protein
VRISVRDTGEGMAPDLAQLFQPFNRLGKEAGAEEGTGIGLVVTKRLVELMGGASACTARVGWAACSGSNWAAAAGAAVCAWPKVLNDGATARAAAPAAGVPRRTVLYVEDNPANLELVEQLIARRPDLRLLSAADGSLGIEFARAHRPDVILMDIHLPGISGVDAMKHPARRPGHGAHPDHCAQRQRGAARHRAGLEAGFFGYLTKPIKVNLFMEALDAALKSSDTEPGLSAEKETA